jgi:hypothetical protein
VLGDNLIEAIKDVDVEEQPDLIVVPGRLVAACGQYRRITQIGEEGSEYRKNLIVQHGGIPNYAAVEFYEGEHSLYVWLIWFLSWLKRAGERNSELLAYGPKDDLGV